MKSLNTFWVKNVTEIPHNNFTDLYTGGFIKNQQNKPILINESHRFGYMLVCNIIDIFPLTTYTTIPLILVNRCDIFFVEQQN